MLFRSKPSEFINVPVKEGFVTVVKQGNKTLLVTNEETTLEVTNPQYSIFTRADKVGVDFSYLPDDGSWNGKEAHKFIDSLEIFSLLANVADAKSLVIHTATTTHSQLSEKELEEQGITQGTIRLSIGIEHIDDLIADISAALDKI